MYRLIISLISLLCMVSFAPPAATQSGSWELVETIGQGQIDDVTWLSDGRLVVAGVRGIWVYESIAADVEPRLIESAYGWIHSIVHQNNILATGHGDGSVTLWDTALLTETAHFGTLTGSINTVDLSAEGTRVVLGSSQTGVQVWDVPSQTLILDLPIQESIDDLVISPDGRWLYLLNRPTFAQTNDLGNASQFDVIDIEQPENRQKITNIGSDRVEHLAISSDGRWVALPGSQGLSVWDTQANSLVFTDIGATSNTIPLFTEEALYLYQTDTLTKLELATWVEEESQVIDTLFIASQGALSDDWLALVGYEGHFDETLHLWNRASGATFDFAYQGSVHAVTVDGEQVTANYELVNPSSALSPWLAVWHPNAGLVLTDKTSGAERLLPMTVDAGTTLKQIVFSPDSQRIAVSLSPDQHVSIWEIADGTLLHSFNSSRIDDMAWNDTYFAANTPDGVLLWGNDQWAVSTKITPPDGYGELFNLRLVLGNEHIIVWTNPTVDSSGGECIGCSGTEAGFVFFSANMDDNRLEKRLDTLTFTALSVALDADEALLVVGAKDGYVYFIDLLTGETIETLDTRAGAVTSVQLDEQGHLITGHASGIVQIWAVQ